MANDVSLLNRDQELARAIANGEITQKEVDEIWANTTNLSAQTPIEVRRAILLMKQAGSLEKAWPLFYKEMMRMNSEIMAAFNRDESKFAHLVAGTESIVKTLQQVNPLATRLDQMSRAIFALTEEVRELKRENTKMFAKQLMKQVVDTTLFPEEVIKAAKSQGVSKVEDVDPDGLPLVRRAEQVDVDDYERDAEQARQESIGSAWAEMDAKKNNMP